MSFFESIKNLFCGHISDEEVAETDWVYCPKCDVNYEKDVILDNDCECPKCGMHFDLNSDDNE